MCLESAIPGSIGLGAPTPFFFATRTMNSTLTSAIALAISQASRAAQQAFEDSLEQCLAGSRIAGASIDLSKCFDREQVEMHAQRAVESAKRLPTELSNLASGRALDEDYERGSGDEEDTDPYSELR